LLAGQVGAMISQQVAIADDLRYAFGGSSFSTMEYGDAVARLLKVFSRERANESSAADEKDLHGCTASVAECTNALTWRAASSASRSAAINFCASSFCFNIASI